MTCPSRETLKWWMQERWGWVITGATCVIFFVNIGFFLSFSIVFVALQEEFGCSATETARVGSIPFGLICTLSPIVNAMLQRLSHRFVAVIGVMISTTGIVVTSFMPNLYPMYATYSLASGFGLSLLQFTSFNLLLTYFPVQNSTRAVVLPMAFSNLGMLSIGPFVYFLINRLGWRLMLRTIGLMNLVITVPVCLLIFRPPSTIPTSSDDTRYRNVPERKPDPPQPSPQSRGERYDDIVVGHNTNKTMNASRASHEHGQEDASFYQQESSNNYEAENTQGEGSEMLQKDRHDMEKDDEHDEGIIDKRRSWQALRRLCFVLSCPDVLLLAVSIFGYGLVNSFVIVQLGNFMLSVGLTEENGAQAVVAMGVSLMTGKVLLVLFADRAPFPKLGFFVIGSVCGILILVILLHVHSLAVVMSMTAALGVTVMGTADSLPYSICNHIFGMDIGTEALVVISTFHGVGFGMASFLGESVDQTGSYDMALYACIGAYALCGLLCVFVPVYQQCFVKNRHVMDISFGWRRMQEITAVADPPKTLIDTNEMMIERVSSV